MDTPNIKPIPLKDRLKTIKDYHIMGDANRLSKAFVEKAINDALEHVEMVENFKLGKTSG